MRESSLRCRRILSLYVVFAFVFLPFVGTATADGCVVGKQDTVFYLGEDSQYAVIDYSEGIEGLLLSIDFQWQDSSSTAWIFPIPADPNSIDVHIVDGAPEFRGTDVMTEAKEDLDHAMSTFVFAYAFSVVIPWPLMTVPYFLLGGLLGTGTGATVHMHLEQYGLIVEVISATEGAGIYNYLTNNGLDVSEGMIPQLDDYVEEDYSFVVTWISESGTTLRKPGVLVHFPTERMFYPLVLTSIYGNKVIPTEIFVMGHVSPRIYDEIEPYTDVTYLQGSISSVEYSTSPSLHHFVEEIDKRWGGFFTRIEISAPSNSLRNDLWISREVPGKVVSASYVHALFDEPALLPTLLIMVAGVSLLMGFLVGVAVLGYSKEAIPAYLVIGMANVVGIIGVIIATSMMRNRLGMTVGQSLAFVGLFCLAFFVSMLAIFGALYVSLA